jgi:hypothetical protein
MATVTLMIEGAIGKVPLGERALLPEPHASNT